jgi:hypothetical protein
LTLGWLIREVVVDVELKKLTVRSRYFWAFTRRRCIRFGDVEAVTYGYEDWAIGSVLNWSHDSLDLYSVGLRLFDEDELHLFNFFGDGTFTNERSWPDWLDWQEEYVLDVSGTQDRESRVYVELLSKLIGVSVIPARS